MKIRPEAPDVRHTHLSAHDGHASEALARYVGDSATWADLLTLTGVSAPATVEMLRSARGMWFYQGSLDEAACDSAIGWGPAWDFACGSIHNLSGGPSATSVVLQEYQSPRKILVSVSRMPAEAEELGVPWKFGFYHHTLLAWKRHVTEMTEDLGVSGAMVVSDWNLDIERPWIRRWVRLAWPELHNTRRANPVYKVDGRVLGTHGSRATDWTLSDLSVVIPAHVRSDPQQFSHRPYYEGLAFPA